MKELSQIRMAVLDALRGAGIQAMEVFPEKQAMAYSGVVAAVGVGAASGKTAGFCHYLGEMKDPETQAVRERYGKELFGQITVELRANRAADCERGCETATEVLLGGLPEGVRTGELTWEAICWEKTTGMFLRRCFVQAASFERHAHALLTCFCFRTVLNTHMHAAASDRLQRHESLKNIHAARCQAV